MGLYFAAIDVLFTNTANRLNPLVTTFSHLLAYFTIYIIVGDVILEKGKTMGNQNISMHNRNLRIEEVEELLNNGYTVEEAAKALNIDDSVVREIADTIE